MRDIDRMIKESLSQDEMKELEAFDEPSMLGQVMDSLRGRSRTLVVFGVVHIVVMLTLAGVSLWQFFKAETLHELIFWASLFVVGLLAVGMVKIWYWMELVKNSILREMKRLEYQVACLNKHLVDRGQPRS